MKPVIEVSNLSKSYQISHLNKAGYNTIKDDFAKIIKRPFGGGSEGEAETFWALKDINFTVNQGETFGIVGKNGSGKSTLLKILSRIVEPTTGQIKISGKLASLLEVGTGFHPELTGRENIYFNGSVIGMSREEIDKKFKQIVEFSEVEKFLDTPVKFYSSGMFVRLAFSVAAHLDSEVLILDEVLSVGDAGFQKKSMDKMLSIAKEGRTILFVSHNTTSVMDLCQRAILLEDGKIIKEGDAYEVVGTYTKKVREFGERRRGKDAKKGNSEVRITKVAVTNSEGKPVIRIGDRVKLRVEFSENFKKHKICRFIADFSGPESRPLFRPVSPDFKIADFEGNWLELESEPINLVPTRCDLTLALHIDGQMVDYLQNALSFKIEPPENNTVKYDPELATVIVPVKYKIKETDDQPKSESK